ncbi:MAG TPA: DNA helicase UvrD [Polyangiaceae bacterium]|nr:DNA helicase UvrD [Polyangiaceae bacterium]
MLKETTDKNAAGPDGTDEPDVGVAKEEEAICDEVVDHLRKLRPSRPPKSFGNEDRTLIALRDQIATSRLEDVPALMAQMEQVAAIASNRTSKPVEPIDPESPYFGHLRLDEEGRGVRDVLIGRTTHIDPKANVRIVDWRHAPVSQLYYRYDEGAEYEEEFGEREVVGKVLVRRTVTIENGQLRRVQAPQGVFLRTPNGWRRLAAGAASLSGGEGSAVRAEHMSGVLGVLGGEGPHQREDRHLPEIAALLDPKQFEVISKEDTGLVVVQGGAGSGKTTIGVHRMAYLAYQSKQRFAPDRMLVVVGTPALRDYIGVLLDALGMGRVGVVTFDGWARKMRRRMFPWTAKMVEEDNTPTEVSRYKTDPRLLPLMERAAEKLRKERRVRPRDAVWLWAEVLTSKAAVLEAFAGDDTRLSKAQLERALSWCADRCPAVVEWQTDLDEGGEEMKGADGLLEQDDERATLDVEDEALLLRAYQLLVGPLRSGRNKALSYEHMFVDEAQDLAPVDLCVLADVVSEGKSITLAGDLAQRLQVDTGFSSWSEVLNALDLEHRSVEPLQIAYRSTKEVLRFATDVLGPLATEEPIAPRSGAPVEHHAFPSQGAAAAFIGEALRPLLQREPRATVCVLARYAEQAEAYYRALRMAEVPHLRHVQHYDFSFKPGVELTDVRQVKGLEYDYVVLVDVNASSYPDDDEARYQLHIGATRAAHQLWVISTSTPSPLIPAWLLEGAD